MSNTKNGKPLKYKYLSDLHTTLSELSLQERVHQFQIKEDRAAVLVPALEIFTSIMRWTNAQEIFVPKIGLADGLIKMLYSEIKHA
jgi:exopolyphosphatase/guanosine-5'-triphosphate,3'-diphosphate pyrophosphatase